MQKCFWKYLQFSAHSLTTKISLYMSVSFCMGGQTECSWDRSTVYSMSSGLAPALGQRFQECLCIKVTDYWCWAPKWPAKCPAQLIGMQLMGQLNLVWFFPPVSWRLQWLCTGIKVELCLHFMCISKGIVLGVWSFDTPITVWIFKINYDMDP